MEDLKASLAAAAVGSIAIGGFWMARPNASAATFRVKQQTNLSMSGLGLDVDAAVMFRLAIPASFKDGDRAIQYRIVDRENRVYPIVPMVDPAFFGAFKLQRGYAQRAIAPRLVAVAGSEVLASTSIGDLPEPSFQGLAPKPNPMIALVLHDSWIDVRPRARIPRNERWRVVVRRTQFGPVPDVWTMLPSRGLRSAFPGLTIPYADQAEAVEVEVTRYRLREHKSTVDVPGFRLHEGEDGVGISVSQKWTKTTQVGPLTALVQLPQQDTGPYRTKGPHPPRIARANMNVIFAPLDDTTADIRRESPLGVRTAVEVLSPSPKDLGVSELRLGPSYNRSDLAPDAPLKTGPFTARLLLTAWKPEEVSRFKAVLPIEAEPPSPSPIASRS